MRGHWISTTRKLNKHYQDGGVGQPAPPFVLTLGEFYMGGGVLPIFRHLDDRVPAFPSGDGEYYNTIEIQRFYNSYCKSDFAKARKFYGYRDPSKHMFVGGFYEDPDYGGADWAQAAYDRITGLQTDHTIAEPLDASKQAIYRDSNIRYSSFHYPDYWYSTPYYYEDYNRTIHHQVSQWVKSGLEMSPEGYRNSLYPYGVTMVNFVDHSFVVGTYVNGVWTGEVVEPEDKNEQYFNLWTMTQAGQSHIPLKSVTVYINGYPRTVKGRIYCFIFNGVYYVDQIVHTGVVDPDTGVWEPVYGDEPVSLTEFGFPYHGLGGYCKQNPFVCPSNTPYFVANPQNYPRPTVNEYSSGTLVDHYPYETDGTANMVGIGMIENFDVKYTYSGITFRTEIYMSLGARKAEYKSNDNRMWMQSENDADFWIAEGMWHAQYGGTSHAQEFPNGEDDLPLTPE